MKSRRAAVAVSMLAISGSALLGACGGSKNKTLDAAAQLKLCTTMITSALALTQSFNVAAFAHSPTPSDLKDIDTQMQTLRDSLKNLPTGARMKMSALLDAAGTARAQLAAGKSFDAASVSLAEQTFASSCS